MTNMAYKTLVHMRQTLELVNEHHPEQAVHDIRVGCLVEMLNLIARGARLDIPDPASGLIEFVVAYHMVSKHVLRLSQGE